MATRAGRAAITAGFIGLAAIVSAGAAHDAIQAPLRSAESPVDGRPPTEDARRPIDFFAAESGDEERLLMLHQQLVEIDSVTGHESDIAQYLTDLFEDHGFQVDTQEVTPRRLNVLAYPQGVDGGKSIVLVTSHIDTVPPYIPYSTHDDEGNTTVWGRGSVDAKASVAAQIAATMHLLNPNRSPAVPHDALSLLFVVGEETNGDGMKHFSAHAPHNYSAVIFGEPTEAKLACGHKGIMMFNITVQGKAAHSGYPWLGVSANNLLHEALGAMLYVEQKLPRSDQYGPSTLNIGRIDGGVAANVVAEQASAAISIRLAGGTPQEAQQLIRKELEGVQQKAKKNGGRVDVEFSGNGYPPQHMICDVDGFDQLTVNYGTDVPNLDGTHDRYLYGPGSIFVAHGPDEHLTQAELKEAVGQYEKLILHALTKAA